MSSNWIDISIPLEMGMVHWPSDPKIQIKKIFSLTKGDAANVSLITMGSHTGTHMDAPSHAHAVMQLFSSRDNQKNWARAIAMMRHGFGGHPYGPDAGIVRERRQGRIGGFPPEASHA